MGTIHHNAVIVTGWNEHVDQARDKALEIYGSAFADDAMYDGERAQALVGPVIEGLTNGYRTFLIAPDGSKEGWAPSDEIDRVRDEFLSWLASAALFLDYVSVAYGELGLQVKDDHEREFVTWE